MSACRGRPIIVFTDGAAKGNPGPGGWGAVLLFPDDHVLELGGADGHTTNNRMEMMAAIEALELLAERAADTPVLIYTDSSYVVNGVTKWVAAWRRREWKKADGQAVLNRDLWERLADAAWARTRRGGLEWRRVAGHAGIAGNERADEIASELALVHSVELYDGPASAYSISLAELCSAAPASTGGSTTERARKARSAGVAKSKKSRARVRAHSYLSLVDGVARRHASWMECERQVKGRSGARYKKTRDAADERAILADWGASLEGE